MILTSKPETDAIYKIVTLSIPQITRGVFKVLGMKYTTKDHKQYQALNVGLLSLIIHKIYNDLDRYKEE